MSKLPVRFDVIGSHVIYKSNILDRGSYYCKARIALHGYQDNQNDYLSKDSIVCTLIVVRMLLPVFASMCRHVSQIDVKRAFLQSGAAERDAFVASPRQCRLKRFYMLLLVAAYGLLNANVIWQQQSDHRFLEVGLTQSPLVFQLFYIQKSIYTALIVIKILDNILFGVSDDHGSWYVGTNLAKSYKLATICHTP